MCIYIHVYTYTHTHTHTHTQTHTHTHIHTHTGKGALGNGMESRRQLELNNEIASLIHNCAGATSLSGRSGSGAALVDAGLLTRKQLEEALHVTVRRDEFATYIYIYIYMYIYMYNIYMYMFVFE